jgi:uncharacterized repeat protein (TIGR01451 family)
MPGITVAGIAVLARKATRGVPLVGVLAAVGLVAMLPPSSSWAAGDLSVAVQASPDPGTVGVRLSYAVGVSNGGPDEATGVIVTASLPAEADVLEASASRGSCAIGRTATCGLGVLEPGEVTAIIISVRPTAAGRLTSVMTIASAAPGDSNPANNMVSVGTKVRLRRGACANPRFGTRLDDVLLGTPGGDNVSGRAGDDRLRGRRGADCLFGQPGDDRLSGGSGSDLLSGGDGDDQLAGGRGRDRIFGNIGRDTVRGGAGEDAMAGRGGADTLYGGPGNDVVSGGEGADSIGGAELVDAGPGDDFITAGARAVVRCGPGNDRVLLGGPARLSGCERVVRQSRFRTRGRHSPATICGGVGCPKPRTKKRCHRRHCRPGGIPGSVGPPEPAPAWRAARWPTGPASGQ